MPQSNGDSNKITREYFDSILVEMRQIDACLADTAFELFGRAFKTPVMMAALSHMNGTHPGGMVELARGAALAGAVMWAGMGDEAELEGIIATGAPTIKIIKPYADEDMVYKKIAHAQKAGALAVGVDIDHAISASGGHDVVLGHEMRPVSASQLRGWVRSTSLPFIAKGVLSEADAVKCAEAGVRGIVVSHHHGIMSDAVPPLMVLPEIRRAVGDDMLIFADCGFASGMDAFKALCLGADALSLGRAIMPALQKGGAQGVCDEVRRVTGQLKSIMARTGAADLSQISGDALRFRAF